MPSPVSLSEAWTNRGSDGVLTEATGTVASRVSGDCFDAGDTIAALSGELASP